MTHLARFTPAEFNKAFVGFDTLFNTLETRFANTPASNYPPYNIAKLDENLYEVSMAVTGFAKNEITVQVEMDELIVSGVRTPGDEQEPEYLHRGLALRDFERKFTLVEHTQVKSAEIQNGILSIKIERIIPEEMKPKLIDITEVK